MPEFDDQLRSEEGVYRAATPEAFSRPANSPLADLSVCLRLQQAHLTATIIAHDLTCKKCGYNLRTLSAAGRCPECASPVQDSIPAEVFTGASRWLRQMRAGAVTIVIGACLSILATLLVLLTAALINDDRFISRSLVVLAIGLTTTFIGGWILAANAPVNLMGSRICKSRIAARIFLAFGVAGILLMGVVGVAGLENHWLVGCLLAAPILLAAGSLGFPVELHYLRAVALRLRDRRAAGRIISVRAGLYVTISLFSLWAVTMVVGRWLETIGIWFESWPQSTTMNVAILALVDLFVLGIFGLMYLFMLVGFIRQITAHLLAIEQQRTVKSETANPGFPL